MELSEQIISKTEINARAVEALLAIISNGLVATKTDLAECLGAKPAKFSEILNYRMKVGIDMIAKICDLYYVNPEWVLMGRGNHIFNTTTKREPYFIEDENDLDRIWHGGSAQAETSKADNTALNQGATNERAAMAEMFYKKTLEQAELIGQLKARIIDLESRLEKNAAAANIGDTANVG